MSSSDQDRQNHCVGEQAGGHMCVLRGDDLLTWSVAVCRGATAPRQIIKSFATEGEANTFAAAECARLRAAGGTWTLHLSDDCPCYRQRGRRL